MRTLLSLTWSRRCEEEGATAVEYALMISLIALAIVAAVSALGLAIPGMLQPAADALAS